MTKKGGIGFIIGGGISGLSGMFFCIGGKAANRDYGRQLKSIFSSGRGDSTGDAMTTMGIAFIIIGLILIAVGIAVYFSANKASIERGLSGRYIGQTTNNQILLNPNGSCIWTQNGMNFPGKFKKVNSNLWIIELSNASFHIQSDGVNLLIYNNSYKDTFVMM